MRAFDIVFVFMTLKLLSAPAQITRGKQKAIFSTDFKKMISV